MTYYVCKQCNYKHTFLPLACAKCKGTNFYPLVTSEPTGNTSICNRMEIQEDVLKLRIEKEQLETENNKLLDVINNQDVKIADLEKENAELKEQIEDLKDYVIKVSKFLHNNNNIKPNALAYKERDILLIKELKLFEKWEIKENG